MTYELVFRMPLESLLNIRQPLPLNLIEYSGDIYKAELTLR